MEGVLMAVISDAHELVTRLGDALGWQSVLTGAATARYTVQGQIPRVVALPKHVEGVSATLALASELAVAVVPWGGGTRQQLGHPPSRCDLVLSLEHLARVLAYHPTEQTITCQAGITHAALAETLALAGQMLALDVPLPTRATLGGTLATATAGLRRGFYGAPRDLALGLHVADASGALLRTGGRVVRTVTGYDMTRLYVGSLGTLGVITEATLTVVPKPAREVTLIGTFAEMARALAAAEPLAALPLRPSAVVVLHPHALPPLATQKPQRPDSALIAARLPGPETAVERAAQAGVQALRARGAQEVLPLCDGDQRAFWSAATDFAHLAAPADEALVRVATSPAEIRLVPSMADLQAREHGLALTWLVDAISGVAWLRLRPPAGQPTPPPDRAPLGHSLAAIQNALVARWGTSVLLACDPALKAHLAVWGAAPAGIETMREVKETLDPAHLLNPGRFLTAH
jgi:glycolate oxidase FAD binding subunit